MENPTGTASIEIMEPPENLYKGTRLPTTIYVILAERGIETNYTITYGIATFLITVSAEAAAVLNKELPKKGFPLALPN